MSQYVRQSHTVNVPSTKETVFIDGEKYVESLLNDILQAKKQIDLETYIFDDDLLGHKIADALVVAAGKGAKVRVLVDGVGTPGWGGILTKKMEAAGVETRVFHPLPWRLWQWRRAINLRLPFLAKLLFFISRMNKRNHRKVCMIDKTIVYIGSANVCECHLSKNGGGKNWRDTVVRLNKIKMKDLEMAFEAAWNHTPIQERLQHIFQPVSTASVIRLNNTRHRRRVLYKNLLRRLSKCQRRVWITNAYFVPDNFLLKKIHELAGRGIDVRILLPQKADIFLMPWASAAFYASLLRAGVRIFEYMPSMLHAKSLILDDWFIVGSSNLNHRSLLHDLEVDVNIQESASKEVIEQQFVLDLSCSKEVELSSWNKRAWYQKVFGRLLLYIKYWI